MFSTYAAIEFNLYAQHRLKLYVLIFKNSDLCIGAFKLYIHLTLACRIIDIFTDFIDYFVHILFRISCLSGINQGHQLDYPDRYETYS
jgi:hypothetical protein